MKQPRIITARELGLSFQDVFGELGPEEFITGHWSAGPVDHGLDDGIRLVRQIHRDHKAKGWGGGGYHYCVLRQQDKHGRPIILCIRPTALLGAHVGMHNSRNIGVMFNGRPGMGEPSVTQRRGFLWLIENAHTRKMPAAHRTDLPLTEAKRMGHNDWSGHESNQCPGIFKHMILSGGTAR